MKRQFILIALLGVAGMASAQTKFQPQDTEFYEPVPRVVSTKANAAPSDAIVLFDGTNLNAWVSDKDGSTSPQWTIANNTFTVKPGTGGIQTKQTFEDFQLHIEWKSPELIKGEGQGRGNSGLFLQGIYELQILDNNNNKTYTNGQAGSIYKQRPPLVEARKAAGEWHTYDIVYTAPRFNKDGHLIKKGTVTVLHNGVLVQNNTELEGTTEFIGLPKMKAHGAGPIGLQDHGDLVSFRNIWIRPL
ncbi:3-keto-disaccharide hydrolase [Sphingobacterium sp. HJSM2_6]|uniref:3-keto-disaccharide hydrolase n=1 Tax=Sphingobacterium sp. HJSM2_6 TaxID=3366264 RepID=UPI003BCC4E4B